MSIKKMFFVIYAVTGVAILCLGMATFNMFKAQKALNDSHENRYKSYQVAIELRQNSDNLTRLVRTYVVTGDEKYARQYWDLVDIANGKKPRKDGRTITFEQMMRELNFSEDEFRKIKESNDRSNELVATEERAINAMKGLFQDQYGKYTVQGKPDIELARRLVHDEKYHKFVESINEPIDEFYKLLDKRTQAEVDSHIADSYFYLYVILASILFLLLSQIVNYVMIRRKVNKPIEALSKATDKVIKGDMSAFVDYKSNDEMGQLSGGFNLMLDKIKDEMAKALSFQMGLSAAVFIADRDTKILSINDSALKMMKFNRKPEDIIDHMKVKEVFFRDSLTHKAFEGKFMDGVKLVLKDHAGGEFPVLFSTGPVLNSKKEMIAAFAYFIDLRDLENQQKKYLNDQIAPIAGVIEAVAQGDFTRNLELDEKSDLYKLGQNVNIMIGDLHNTLSMVSEAIQATASAANEISSSSEQMAAGAQEQSQQATEVAGAIEEMTKTVYETAKNANEAADMSRTSRVAAEK
ncbi:MAG TPA: HAMP domain-containing protein, partial [Ignavibacteriales bacterium]|nr:HAMP domain-containing protein [Ignavibacteriales bacterium]